MLGRRKGGDVRVARREDEKEGVVQGDGREDVVIIACGVVSLRVCVCVGGFAAAARTGYGRRAASGKRRRHC